MLTRRPPVYFWRGPHTGNCTSASTSQSQRTYHIAGNGVAHPRDLVRVPDAVGVDGGPRALLDLHVVLLVGGRARGRGVTSRAARHGSRAWGRGGGGAHQHVHRVVELQPVGEETRGWFRDSPGAREWVRAGQEPTWCRRGRCRAQLPAGKDMTISLTLQAGRGRYLQVAGEFQGPSNAPGPLCTQGHLGPSACCTS